MRRALRLLGAVALLVAVAVFLGNLSGRQPDRDAEAAAARELGTPLDSRMVDVGDVRLHVVIAGPAEGQPVVLLHGFPEFWYAWRYPMAQLARAGLRVIVPDQRGYNLSDKPPGIEAYRVENLAADIAKLITMLGYENANVAGHDWGGGVAWQVAIRHPQVVRRLAVIDTPHPRAREGFESKEEKITWYRTFMQIPWIPEWSARLSNYTLLAGSLRDTSKPGTFPEETMDLFRSAWDRPGARTAMVNWYRAAFRHPPDPPGDQRVAIPTLVVVAPEDAFIPSDLSRRSMCFLENGSLVELQNGTHWVIQEDPDTVSRLLRDFFLEGTIDPQFRPSTQVDCRT